MDVTALLTDVKAHLEHGAELLASHVPALVELAGKIEADPLVQTAINLAVPETTRSMLVALLKSVEADVAQVTEAAKAAAAAPPAEPAAPAA
jgi:hypothetical protein